ncbi:MAG: NAD-dependent epimerase/dehydratase family protein [Magnetococcus sp. YQC-3]
MDNRSAAFVASRLASAQGTLKSMTNKSMNGLNAYYDAPVLITGGAGFIGSNLARRLVSLGAKVTVVDNMDAKQGGNKYNLHDIKNNLQIKNRDIRQSHALDELAKRNNFLFNLASQTCHSASMQNPVADAESNISAQLNILESCRRHNNDIKIVFTSTRQVYGRPCYLPVDELHRICPTDINAVHKRAGELYHEMYNKLYGIRSCVLRLTNTYGPGMRIKDDRQNFMGIWFRLLLEGKTINIFGDGQQIRDINYIDDCVDALLLAGASDRSDGNVYNIGGRQPINLHDLARLMIKFTKKGSIKFIPFPEDRKKIDIGDYVSDYSMISNDLHWYPKVHLEQGVQKTVEFYKKHFMRYL